MDINIFFLIIKRRENRTVSTKLKKKKKSKFKKSYSKNSS